MSIEDKLEKLDDMNARALQGGGPDRIEKQHSQGKLTARERVDKFFDPGTFVEIDKFVQHRCHDFDLQKNKVLGDGVVTGYGRVGGRQTFVFAQDFTVFGGSLSHTVGEKICKVMDLAMKVGAPLVGLNDGAGARIQEGVFSLAGYGEIFARNTLASGVIPQISGMLGPCAGGAVYSPAITDFIVMVKNTASMMITGPDVIRSVTREEVTPEQLGGALTHSTRSGVSDFAVENEDECLQTIRALLSYMPQNNHEPPPFVPTQDPSDRMDPELRDLVPDNPNKGYDIKDLIRRIADDGVFLETSALWAPNLVVGFCRMGGRSVGIVANQPAYLAGSLDIEASKKGGRFVRFCDSFNIPLVTLVDTPGFLPGVAQEHSGIITHGAKLLYAFCEATVPRITVITRKAYGGAYLVMNSKHVRCDINFAYPTSEIAVMGPEGAVNVVFRKEIKAADDADAKRAELVADYRNSFASPYQAAELGYLDAVIRPEQTRPRIIDALEMLATKRAENPPKKHGNIPL